MAIGVRSGRWPLGDVGEFGMMWRSRALGSIGWVRQAVVVVVHGRNGMGRVSRGSRVGRSIHAEPDRFAVAINGLGARSDDWVWWAIFGLWTVGLEVAADVGGV